MSTNLSTTDKLFVTLLIFIFPTINTFAAIGVTRGYDVSLEDRCDATCSQRHTYTHDYSDSTRLCVCGDGAVFSVYSVAAPVRTPQSRVSK